jgi:hypothetical protein
VGTRSIEYYEKARVNPLGKNIDAPFNAGNYVGSGGIVWTVGAGGTTNNFSLAGGTMFWNVYLGPSTTSGSPAPNLLLQTPGGITAIRNSQTLGLVVDPATGIQVCYMSIIAGNAFITISRLAGGNFGLGSLSLTFQMQIFFDPVAITTFPV